jgi:hypothetical protein
LFLFGSFSFLPYSARPTKGLLILGTFNFSLRVLQKQPTLRILLIFLLKFAQRQYTDSSISRCFNGARDVVAEVVIPKEEGRSALLAAFVWWDQPTNPTNSTKVENDSSFAAPSDSFHAQAHAAELSREQFDAYPAPKSAKRMPEKKRRRCNRSGHEFLICSLRILAWIIASSALAGTPLLRCS